MMDALILPLEANVESTAPGNKRLGASGVDAWTLARIAGHSSIAISSRYVHPSEDAILKAISELGRHNSGHNQTLGKLAI